MYSYLRHKLTIARIKCYMEMGTTSLFSHFTLDANNKHKISPYPFTKDFVHERILSASESYGVLPSCSGYAVCNWIEWLINKYCKQIPKNKQLNGKLLWESTLQRGYGKKSTMVLLEDVINTALHKKLILGTHKTLRSKTEIINQLVESPVILGMEITDNWISEVCPKTGFITPNDIKIGGHAVVLIGVKQYNNVWYGILLNSWGHKWGKDGTCMLSLDRILDLTFSAFVFEGEPGQYKNFLTKR